MPDVITLSSAYGEYFLVFSELVSFLARILSMENGNDLGFASGSIVKLDLKNCRQIKAVLNNVL